MSAGDKFNYFFYNSSNGKQYTVKLSNVVALAGGFTQNINPLAPGTNFWPWKARNMRHVTGKSSSGSRARCPIADESNALYTSGGTFALVAGNFTVLGGEGERRPASGVR